MMVDRPATLIPVRRNLGRRPWQWLIGFCAAGWALRLAAALTFTAIERPDEIFQNLEPAYRLWTGHGIITWEWRTGIRSWLFSGALSSLMSLTSLLHLPDCTAIPLIWAILSLVSCGVIAVGVGMGWRLYGTTGAVLGGILTALWPDLVYFGPKTLGEVQSGNLLVVAAALASVDRARHTKWRIATIGVLLGAAFDLRFQLSVSLLLVACWTARREVRKAWAPLLLGAALPLLMLGLLDWWTLGSPFQSVWKNVQLNSFQNRADAFGVDPIQTYLHDVITRYGGTIVPMSAFFVYGVRAAPLLAMTTISVVAFHSLIPHKEISFIYAALPCAIVTVSLGAARFVEDLQTWIKQPPSRLRARTTAAFVALVTIVAVAKSERPYASSPRRAALMTLFVHARAQPDMCGLGLYADTEFPWFDTGGYAFLQRPVPIYLANSAGAFAESRAGFNYAIAHRLMLTAMPGFSVARCESDYCLFRQPVQCQPTSTHEISDELARTDQ